MNGSDFGPPVGWRNAGAKGYKYEKSFYDDCPSNKDCQKYIKDASDRIKSEGTNDTYFPRQARTNQLGQQKTLDQIIENHGYVPVGLHDYFNPHTDDYLNSMIARIKDDPVGIARSMYHDYHNVYKSNKSFMAGPAQWQFEREWNTRRAFLDDILAERNLPNYLMINTPE